MMNRLTTDELKQMRSELRLSQKEMGELIGVDRGVYNNFEARAVPLKYVDQIIDAYQREKSKLRNMVDKKYTDATIMRTKFYTRTVHAPGCWISAKP